MKFKEKGSNTKLAKSVLNFANETDASYIATLPLDRFMKSNSKDQSSLIPKLIRLEFATAD
jgi:hypothetical protein